MIRGDNELARVVEGKVEKLFFFCVMKREKKKKMKSVALIRKNIITYSIRQVFTVSLNSMEVSLSLSPRPLVIFLLETTHLLH